MRFRGSREDEIARKVHRRHIAHKRHGMTQRLQFNLQARVSRQLRLQARARFGTQFIIQIRRKLFVPLLPLHYPLSKRLRHRPEPS